MIKKAISGFFGAIAGAITGCISGMGLTGAHFWRLFGSPNDVTYGELLGFLIGIPVGAVLGFFRGTYTGATEGLLAGIKFPSTLYTHYFGVEKNNEQIKNHIAQLDLQAHFTSALSEPEIEKFKNYMDNMENQETKKRLQQEFAEYNSYMNQVCPSSKKKVSELEKPITIKTVEQGSVKEEVFDRNAILAEMKYSGRKNAIGLEIPQKSSPFGKSDIILTGYPKRIANFINKVREKLRLILSARQSLQILQADLGNSVVAEGKLDNIANVNQNSFSPKSQQRLYDFIKGRPNVIKEEGQTNESSASYHRLT